MTALHYLRAPRLAILALLGLAFSLMLASPPEDVKATPTHIGFPNSIAAVGDSISQAFLTSGAIVDAPANSWSTGTSAAVNSHYSRILAANPAINGKNFNYAVSGTKMADLNAQMINVDLQNVEYVTVLMGSNDICAANSEAAMTPVATFRAQLETAMATLTAGSPDARIFVASLPDLYRLWFIFKDDPTATNAWSAVGYCSPMLANATSTAPTDQTRRANVRQREIDYNTQLQEVCAVYLHCRFDNNAVFNDQFGVGDVSHVDYFHPSVAGQARLATVSYAATFDFTDATAPITALTNASISGGFNLTLAATDNVSVAGIEYKTPAGTWTRYTGPVTINSGTPVISYRAVDINGNLEASHGAGVVTSNNDDALGTTTGTLSYLLKHAETEPTVIYFAFGPTNIISTSSKLPDVPPGTKLDGGACNGSLGAILSYSGTLPGVDGLTLTGNVTLKSLKIAKFTGRQVINNTGTGNQLSCVIASKT